MEFLTSFNFDMKAIFDASDINKHTQNHLAKVYSTLASGVFTSLIFGYLAASGFISGYLIVALSIGVILAEIASIFMSPYNKMKSQYIKPGTFYGWATIFGSVIGWLFLETSGEERIFLAQITLSAFIYSVLIFVSFSVFALLSVRRVFVFFGSALASCVLGLVSLFIFNQMIHAVFGLILGILYVILDTQMIIHKTESGLFDVYGDAKELLIDFFKIFIEILKILSKSQKKKNKK